LQHNFGRTCRPSLLAFDILKALEETANVDQQSGEFTTGGIKRLMDTLSRGDHRLGESGGAIAPCATADGRYRARLVRRRARHQMRLVKSARSRPPACNCCGSIKGRPSRPRRRASQASGLSDSSIVTVAQPCSVAICLCAKLRCWPRNGSMSGRAASGVLAEDFQGFPLTAIRQISLEGLFAQHDAPPPATKIGIMSNKLGLYPSRPGGYFARRRRCWPSPICLASCDLAAA
jgi:hypothetical protein